MTNPRRSPAGCVALKGSQIPVGLEILNESVKASFTTLLVHRVFIGRCSSSMSSTTLPSAPLRDSGSSHKPREASIQPVTFDFRLYHLKHVLYCLSERLSAR